MDAAFPSYVVTSDPPGVSFYVVVLGYMAICLLLIGPLVSMSQNAEEERQQAEEPPHKEQETQTSRPIQAPQTAKESVKKSSMVSGSIAHSGSNFSKQSARTNRSGRGFVVFLDRVAAAQYPDQNPEFSRISGPHSRSGGTAQSMSSGTPSAATTSRLLPPKNLSSMVLDVGGRRWTNRRPIGRMDVIQNAISSGSTISGLSSVISKPTNVSKAKGMSDLASSVLQETQESNSNPVTTGARHPSMMQYHRSRFLRRPSRAGSYSARSEKSMDRSIMSSIVDDISPNDAADANDPGRGNIFTQPQDEIDPLKLGCCSGLLGSLLVLASPGEEMRRVVYNSIPLAVGAMSEAVVRLVTAIFISHYLGSEAMIAYILVGLFVRQTSEELSGAIIDSASSFVQGALYSEHADSALVVGRYIQHAVVLQLLLGVPLLAAWSIYMENVVQWLIQSDGIAHLARDYTRVVALYFLVQAVTRTCTVVFHICGHEHFESVIDFTTLILQLIVVACVVVFVENASLTTVGYIQVLIGVVGAFAKLIYPVMRGWMKPFCKGIFGQVALFYDAQGFVHICRAVIPLLVGTLLEYGQWEVLTLVVHQLGSAEVAAWAILGALWDVLEALTEGIGEAAAIQVAFLLVASQPERARRLANTVMYLAIIQSLIVTSLLFMLGKYLSVILTLDSTLQHFINNSISLLGLANVTMAFSQVGWSLIGAQGRFRLATSVVFVARWLVTIPAALLIVLVWKLDIDALGGALVLGYSTSSCAMTFIVLRSDWERLSRGMEEMNRQNGTDRVGGDNDEDDHGDPFDDEDDDSSSEGFGFGGGADEDSRVTRVKSEASRSIQSKVKERPPVTAAANQ